MIAERIHASLLSLEKYVNAALDLKHHSSELSGFSYNRDLLGAAVANTYIETVGSRSDSIYLRAEKSPLRRMSDSLFSRIAAITRPFHLEDARCMIAFDYTTEEFYGQRDSLWVHGWTGEHGVSGKYSYLTASLVNRDLRLPLLSLSSPMGNDMPSEVTGILERIRPIIPNIDLVLFDRGFYSKELMYRLHDRVRYLIFAKKDELTKGHLNSMIEGQRKIMRHEFSFYRSGHRIAGDTYLAFLRKVFDRRTEEYFDWVFATNVETIDLEKIIAQYKIRWRIETMFRVQDESRIKTKSKDIHVRYFLFAYEQLIEALWYLYYREEVSFKKFLIELSSMSSMLVDREERRKAAHS